MLLDIYTLGADRQIEINCVILLLLFLSILLKPMCLEASYER